MLSERKILDLKSFETEDLAFILQKEIHRIKEKERDIVSLREWVVAATQELASRKKAK